MSASQACRAACRSLLCAALAAAALAPGCDGEPETIGAPPQEAPVPGEAAIPEGAIRIEDDVYMVPAGEDETGCPQFTMFSPTKAVIMVIHYRDGQGGFTPERARADCPPARGYGR